MFAVEVGTSCEGFGHAPSAQQWAGKEMSPDGGKPAEAQVVA